MGARRSLQIGLKHLLDKWAVFVFENIRLETAWQKRALRLRTGFCIGAALRFQWTWGGSDWCPCPAAKDRMVGAGVFGRVAEIGAIGARAAAGVVGIGASFQLSARTEQGVGAGVAEVDAKGMPMAHRRSSKMEIEQLVLGKCVIMLRGTPLGALQSLRGAPRGAP